MFGIQIDLGEALAAIDAYQEFTKSPSRIIVVDFNTFFGEEKLTTEGFFNIMIENFSYKSESWLLTTGTDDLKWSIDNTVSWRVTPEDFVSFNPSGSVYAGSDINELKQQLNLYINFKAVKAFSTTFKYSILDALEAPEISCRVAFVLGYLPAYGYCVIGFLFDEAGYNSGEPYYAFEVGSKENKLIFATDFE